MLKIYLCDNEESQLLLLQRAIENEIEVNNYNMKIDFVSTTPELLLEAVKDAERGIHIYFLDIELDADINGIELAHQIRHFDPRAYIIMITGHAQYMPLTFSYMIEPLAYIIKDNSPTMVSQISSCLRLVSDRCRQVRENRTKKDIFSISTKTKNLNFKTKDLYYITTSSIPHILEICSKDRLAQARGAINECMSRLPEYFVKISRETIINTKHIKNFDPAEKSVTLTNDSYFQVSSRQYKELKKQI